MTLSELFFPRRRFLRLSLSSFLCFVGGFSMGSWLTLYHQFQLAERQMHGHGGHLQQQNSPEIGNNLLNILIVSAPRNAKARETLRATWLKLNPSVNTNSKYSTRHFFVIGTEGLGQTLLSKLETEEQLNGDLVILPDLKDSFNNLTLKVGLGLKYLATNHPSRYVLKCDDDSFVRIDEIVNELLEREKLIAEGHLQSGCFQWGFFDGRAPVMRKGKWKEVEYNLCDYYIPYALGGGYVMSSQCVQFIVQNLERLKKFKNEDVSVGTWLAVIGPERRHDVRFDTQYDSRGCNNRYLVQHKITLAQMTERYKNLIVTGRLCEKEEKKRSSWEYDWNVHPSHCCKLNETVI